MPSFNSLTMSSDLVNDSHVQVKKSFFGLSTSAVYLTTNSKLKAFKKEYNPDNGRMLECILTADKAKQPAMLAGLESLTETHLGNYMLEMCVSEDHQFAALRLFHYQELRYKPVTPLLTYEGEDASLVVSSL